MNRRKSNVNSRSLARLSFIARPSMNGLKTMRRSSELLPLAASLGNQSKSSRLSLMNGGGNADILHEVEEIKKPIKRPGRMQKV